jgi:hypothetical protein
MCHNNCRSASCAGVRNSSAATRGAPTSKSLFYAVHRLDALKQNGFAIERLPFRAFPASHAARQSSRFIHRRTPC